MRSLLSSRMASLLLGASMLPTLSIQPTEPTPRLEKRTRRAPRSYSPNYWRFGRSPKVARHWHNPKDPAQAARIEAAKAKRARKDFRRHWEATKAGFNNRAHNRQNLSLQPLYIAQ